MTQENLVAPAPVPFEWSVADYGDDAIYVTALRSQVPIGLITGESRRGLPFGHFEWTFRIFLPGVQLPAPLTAPREALPLVQERFKIAFDDCCVRLAIRPAYPMLQTKWQDLGTDGHGLYSGDHLVHRIWQIDGQWWHESYLNFGPEVASPTFRLPRAFTLVTDQNRDSFENTLEGAKNRGGLWVTGWLLRSHFMMRCDPHSLPVGREG